jgi:ribosome-associated translation inhibitor RaiA
MASSPQALRETPSTAREMLARHLQHVVAMEIEIAFLGLDASLTAEMSARRWIERLRRVYANITACKVVIERPHRHHEAGNMFHVRIEIAVPDRVLVVTRDPGVAAAHDDVYVAIADAFRAARRQLQQYSAVRRRGVRLHAALA